MRSRYSIAGLGRLTQADVPLPWSMCSQIEPPFEAPSGRVGSFGGVPLTRL
ncbi:hypothetical protein STENM327S_05256 [Streptomyces tendae]